jgi:hypothetical protein
MGALIVIALVLLVWWSIASARAEKAARYQRAYAVAYAAAVERERKIADVHDKMDAEATIKAQVAAGLRGDQEEIVRLREARAVRLRERYKGLR